MPLVRCDSVAEVTALKPFAGALDLSAPFAEHGADQHLAWIEDDRLTAQCSLWWSHTPPYLGEKLGVIGHFHAADETGTALLEAASLDLMNRGCTLIVGPMDGNTWRSYRLVTDRGVDPPFFLEPQNPPEWPAYFERAGFSPLAQYYSALNEDLNHEDERIPIVRQRFTQLGVVIRSAKAETLIADLDRIFTISVAAFANNFLYTPLSREAFLEQYRRILPYVDSRLVLLAERNAEPVGFLFAIPDALERQRGREIKTAIIKTLAILPDSSLRGLGSLLVAHGHRVFHELGFRRCINALMHESNASLNISRHFAKVMRRYTLYSRGLRA